MRRAPLLAVGPALVLLATGASAFEPDLPAGARLAAEDRLTGGVLALPVAPWSEDRDAGTVEAVGLVRRRAWRIGGSSYTTGQLADDLRRQAEAAGFEIRLSCADDACGGYDFRYALPLLPEPEMHVDLGDFRHLTGLGADGALLGLTISRGGAAAFVHMAEVTPGLPDLATERVDPGAEVAPPGIPERAAVSPDIADPGAALDRFGHAPLDDLIFARGSAELAPAEYMSLDLLAAWMRDRPEARITLVGHSDATGSLEANVAVSRARAEAVRRRLVDRHGVSPAQLAAAGAGYLAPRAENSSETGRALNRRVEAVRTDAN